MTTNKLDREPHYKNLQDRAAHAETEYLALLEKCKKYERLLRMAPPRQSLTDQRYWAWFALKDKALEEHG